MREEPSPPQQGRSRAFRILKRALVISLGVLLLLCLAGFVYERTQLKRIEREWAPPGERVDIGGRSLHVRVEGSGSPTVILESGFGGSSWGWTRVAPEVAKFTRVVSYDRAGYGWSDPGGTQPVLERVMADLRAALEAQGISGPYVLVGHSLGGLYVRAFCYQHPEEVSGLVLVDPSHEDFDERLPPDFLDRLQEGESLFPWLATLSTIGVPRMVHQLRGVDGLMTESHLLPASAQAAMADLGPRRTQIQAAVHEMKARQIISARVKELAFPLDALPLTVLSARKPSFGLQPATIDAIGALHAELAATSSQGKLRVVEDSAHYIHVERPGTVVEEVRRIVDAVRHRSAEETP